MSVMLLLLALTWRAHGQGLTEEEQEEILNAHNHYRSLVDPIATNMLKMVRAPYCFAMITDKRICPPRNGMMIWPI